MLFSGTNGQLVLPFQDPRPSRSCFSLGNLPGALQGDRKPSKSQWIVRGKLGQRLRRHYGVFKAACIAERPRQSMMSLHMRGIGGNRGGEGFGCLSGIAVVQPLQTALRQRVGDRERFFSFRAHL